MSTQLIDLESGSVATGDSGERTDADAIKPIDAGERVQAAVIDRPFENLRARTEELRQKVEELLYRADADKWIITGGNTIGEVTVPGAAAFPTVSWNATTGLCTVSEAIVVQPFVAPSTDLFGFIDWAFTESVAPFGTVTFRFEANDDPLAGTILYDYQLANSIRVYWESSASLGAGVFCQATLEGSPVHMLRIVVRDDGTTTAAHVQAELNTLLAPVVPDSILKFSLTGLGTTFVEWVETPGRPNEYMFNTYSREMHRMTKTVFDGFFVGSPLSVDGDGIGIWYEELTDSDTTQHGGRRQATPTTIEDISGLAPNTVVPVTKLFKFSTEPEKVPGCIPLCRRIGTYLVFIDGTVVAHNQTIAFGFADSDLLARYAAHIAGTAEKHAAGAITSTPYSWIAASNVGAVINEIVDDLAAVGAGVSGASRIGNEAHSWIASTNVNAAITEIVDDLAVTTTGISGTERIGGAVITSTPDTIAAGTLRTQLSSMVTAINARARRYETENIRGDWHFWNPFITDDSTLLQFSGGELHRSILGGSFFPGLDGWYDSVSGSLGYTYPGNPLHAWNTCTHAGVSGTYCLSAHASIAYLNSTSKIARKLCVATNRAGVIDSGNAGVDALAVFDPAVPSVTTEYYTLGGLPNTGTTAWKILDMCSYGRYLYVYFISNAGVPAARIQCYDASDSFSSVWASAYDPNYTYTLSMFSEVKQCRLMLAVSSTRLCVVRPRVQLGSAQDPILVLNSTTGALVDSGAGNSTYTIGTNWYPTGAMTSDGTHLYYAVGKNSSTWGNSICNVTIAAPSTGLGTPIAQTPSSEVATSYSDRCYGLCYDGSYLWYTTGGLTTRCELVAVDLVTGSTVVSRFGSTANLKYASDICYDGINLWVYVILDNDQPRVFKWDAGASTSNALGDLDLVPLYHVVPGNSSSNILPAYIGQLCFDLDTIWVMPTRAEIATAGYANTVRAIRFASRR